MQPPVTKPESVNEAEKDIFREIPLRYAGYANEVGEAFRNMVAVRFVHVSYAISCGYVLSHAVAQGVTSRNELDRRKDTTHTNLNHSSAHHNFATLSKTNNYVQKQSNLSHGHNSSLSLSPRAAVLDTLLWQGLASVVIPGLIINWLCAASRFLLNRHATRVLSQQFRRWASTGVGLASIPVIIHLIDWSVDKLMDSVIRPHFH